MDDQQKALLNDHGVLILPDEIDHDVFALVLTACLMRPDQPIKMYCRGGGGDATAARGIVDVIQYHGQVVGLLPGEANSAHGTIFAGCSQRYVYPGACLGVHRVALGSIDSVDARYAKNWHVGFDILDRATAKTLAAACTDQKKYGESFWYKTIDKQGSSGLTRFDAAFLIKCGMAQPISELKP